MARKSKKETELIQLTAEAHKDLVKELEHRKNVERANIAAEIAVARDLGDLSENHPYTLAMEKKNMNENRIIELEDMLKKVQIVKASPTGNVVTIGKTVKIINLATKKPRELQLVGSEETQAADPKTGKISVDSPIGKALLNSKLGETVEIKLPAGIVKYKIDKIAA